MASNPTWDELYTEIDDEKIAERVLAVEGKPLESWQFKDVKRAIISAGRRWLVRDLVDIRDMTFEEEIFINDVPGQRTPFHGFIDLGGVLTGRGTPVLKPYAGNSIVVDWKTTSRHVDQDWKDELRQSWQWQLYSHATDARIFMYRGVSLKYELTDGDKETNELILEVPLSNGDEVRTYLQAVYMERQAYVDSGLKVWKQNKPTACVQYGQKCPWLDGCEEFSMPLVNPGDRQLSYSSIKKFSLCPEKHRRDCLVEGKEESPHTIAGKAFHRGIEELYRQAKELI